MSVVEDAWRNEFNARFGESIVTAEKTLPVSAELKDLVGAGLRRGSVVKVSGSVSLGFSLLAEITSSGKWCAVVGFPDAGYEACAQAGVDLSRVVCVPEPGDQWAEVAAMLFEGCDALLLGTSVDVAAFQARRLTARLRRRGSVLIALCEWPSAELRLNVRSFNWKGLGSNEGSIWGVDVDIEVAGKGSASIGRCVNVEVHAKAS